MSPHIKLNAKGLDPESFHGYRRKDDGNNIQKQITSWITCDKLAPFSKEFFGCSAATGKLNYD